LLAFRAEASDADQPVQKLTFTLDEGSPGAAMIDASTGEFRWTPGMVHVGSEQNIRVRVTDDGTPAMSGTGLV
jgi:hypothetical protein